MTRAPTCRWSRVAGLLVALTAAPSARAQAPTWEQIRNEDGITVWRALDPDGQLVTFRGSGSVRASLPEVFAVVYDHEHRCDWQARCAEARVIERLSATEAIASYRVFGFWPVAARDAVFRARVTRDDALGAVQIDFRQLDDPRAPPQDGVVRMPVLEGFWRFVATGPQRTHVTTQVRGDPGGAIPAWIASYVAKNLPFLDIVNIRRHIADGRHGANVARIEALFGGAPPFAARR